MPDLASRPQRESELAAAIWLILQDEAARLESGSSGGWTGFEERLQAAMVKPLAATFEEAAVAIWLILMDDEPINADRLNVASQQWAQQWSASVATGMASNIAAEVQAARAGKSTATIDSILSRGRADSVGVTETTRSISHGEQWTRRQIERAGQTMVAYWVTEKDARVCPVCRPLDGKRQEFWEDEFPTGPPAHPRCRCYLQYEVIGGSSNN